MTGNVINDEDYFMLKLLKQLPNNVRKNTYQHNFKREALENLFTIKKSRASDIISLLLEAGLIEPSEPTKYKFKK